MAKTINNSTGSKSVIISTDAEGTIRAMYVLNYGNEQQVQQAKSFANIKNAQRWAAKVLA